MNDFERLRQFLPFALALYLASSVAQLQANQHDPSRAHATIKLEDVVTGIKEHLREMGKYQHEAMKNGFYAD